MVPFLGEGEALSLQREELQKACRWSPGHDHVKLFRNHEALFSYSEAIISKRHSAQAEEQAQSTD